LPRLPVLAASAAVALAVASSVAVPVLAADPAPQPGSSGPAVLQVQLALRDAGADVPLTAYYGQTTADALSSLHLDPLATLSPGDTGPGVSALQRALTEAGYPVAATGRLGPYTASLVRRFQQDHDMSATGAIRLVDVERANPLYTILGYLDGMVGSRYAWGGSSPVTGFDCSGLVRYVYGQVGINLAHSSYAQWDAGTPVPAGALQPGDLVFFDTWGGGPSHVGIYIGDNTFVHAGTYETGVQVASLDDPYWFHHYVGARRILRVSV
jgi:peptidoglycan hydrolase-like protein with peptidoglycan-binding domain